MASNVDETTMKITFELFDTDKNGLIDRQELTNAFRKIGQNFTNREINHILGGIDIDRNGGIDFQEFCTMMSRHSKSQLEQMETITKAFKLFDRDHTGQIDRYELAEVIKKYSDEELTEEDIEDIISAADTNGNGTIDIHEFTSLILKMDIDE